MMYICPGCGEAISEHMIVRHEDNSDEYGTSAWYSCPECGEEFPNLEEYEGEECPCCHYGWKYPDRPVCKKCALRAEDKLRCFLHEFTADELEALDMMLEGECLTDFAKGEKGYASETIF